MQFVRNGWYVALRSAALGSEPQQRTMLGESVVLYRSRAGEVVALADRCPHRFAPLHKGKVIDDAIECPYHGLRFDASGRCSFNPHGDGRIPQAAQVKRYPTAERDGVVWAWMGPPERAAEVPPPDMSAFLDTERMAVMQGEFVIDAHYECVLDNLLDLSHAPFLHPTTLANPESVQQLHFEMKQEGHTIWAFHHIPDSVVTPQFAPFRDPQVRCDQRAHMRWDPPGTLWLDVGATDRGQPEEAGQFIHMAHLLTPIDDTRTLYTWLAARNFLTDDAGLSEMMQRQIETAFHTEDKPMISDVWQAMGTPDLVSLSPVLLPGDAAAMRARRILQQLRADEQAAAAH